MIGKDGLNVSERGRAARAFVYENRKRIAGALLAGVVLGGCDLLSQDSPQQNDSQHQYVTQVFPMSATVKPFPERKAPDATVKGELTSDKEWVHRNKDGSEIGVKVSYADVKLSNCTTHESIIHGSMPSPKYSFNNVKPSEKLQGNFGFIDASNNVVVCKTATVADFDKPQPLGHEAIGKQLLNLFRPGSNSDEVGLFFPVP